MLEIIMNNEIPAHHVKQEYCETRPKYRRGKKKTAVRVFTVNAESKYLIVSGIPSTGLEKELIKLFVVYGTILQCKELTGYPSEEFTQVFLIVFKDIQPAKVAKKNLDERYFFGGMLHICYAPELETLSDTREKITNRRHSVVSRVKYLVKEDKQKVKKNNKKIPKFQPKLKAGETSKGQMHQENAKVEIVQKSVQLSVSPSDVRLNTPCSEQPHSLICSYHTPCNILGMPVMLPPPLSMNVRPFLYPSQQNVYDAVGLPSASCNKIEMSSKKEGMAAKPIEKKVSKKPKFTQKSGYFYEKVLHTLKTSQLHLGQETNEQDLTSGKDGVLKSNACVSTSSAISSPIFLPRHVELKRLDMINEVETDEDGNVYMFGAHIHKKHLEKD